MIRVIDAEYGAKLNEEEFKLTFKLDLNEEQLVEFLPLLEEGITEVKTIVPEILKVVPAGIVTAEVIFSESPETDFAETELRKVNCTFNSILSFSTKFHEPIDGCVVFTSNNPGT